MLAKEARRDFRRKRTFTQKTDPNIQEKYNKVKASNAFIINNGRNAKKKQNLRLFPQEKLIDKALFEKNYDENERRKLLQTLPTKVRKSILLIQNMAKELESEGVWGIYDDFYRSKKFVLTFQPEKIMEN